MIHNLFKYAHCCLLECRVNIHDCYINMFNQAILPLRGKILNIERKDEAAMYKNEEIQNLILALGLGVKVTSFLVSIVAVFLSFSFS